MNKQRPINIYLLSYKYPVTAIISVLHRVSGLFVFLLIPVLLWALATSLAAPDAFLRVVAALNNPLIKITLWAFLSALGYHLIAGLRHLLMDMGCGEGLASARRSAWATALLALILSLGIGIWLW